MIIPKEHHSVADWDIPAAAHHSLDPSTYVSAPSCLKCIGTNGYFSAVPILCRQANTLNQPEGEIRTWLKCTTKFYQNWLIFRNQTVPGVMNTDNQYYINIQSILAYFMLVVAGGTVTLSTIAISHEADVWEHWRVVFWNGIKPGAGDALAVNLFKEVDSAWVQFGATQYDTDNYFKDTGIARAGIGGSMRDIETWRFDDTEIWGLP